MSIEEIVKFLPVSQATKDKILLYLREEPVKFNSRFVEALIALAAFVAVVFFDQDQISTVGAATAIIAALEKQAASSRDRVSPVGSGEAAPVGGPGGDPSVPPIPLPEDLDVSDEDLEDEDLEEGQD